ncbi:hypothetical protein WD019_10015 [Fictibacillus sp. Mic-4]|uniref:hypothetical protein n=1 Tax=Fictibacillus sp. Mic-4 TaxID=3132826 RepID=UPI003CF42A38
MKVKKAYQKLGSLVLCICWLVAFVSFPVKTGFAASDPTEGFIIKAGRIEGDLLAPKIVSGETSHHKNQLMIRFNYKNATIYDMTMVKQINTPNGPMTITIHSSQPVHVHQMSVDATGFQFGGACIQLGKSIPGVGLENVTLVGHSMHAETLDMSQLSLVTTNKSASIEKPPTNSVLRGLMNGDSFNSSDKKKKESLPLFCPSDEKEPSKEGHRSKKSSSNDNDQQKDGSSKPDKGGIDGESGKGSETGDVGHSSHSGTVPDTGDAGDSESKPDSGGGSNPGDALPDPTKGGLDQETINNWLKEIADLSKKTESLRKDMTATLDKMTGINKTLDETTRRVDSLFLLPSTVNDLRKKLEQLAEDQKKVKQSLEQEVKQLGLLKKQVKQMDKVLQSNRKNVEKLKTLYDKLDNVKKTIRENEKKREALAQQEKKNKDDTANLLKKLDSGLLHPLLEPVRDLLHLI